MIDATSHLSISGRRGVRALALCVSMLVFAGIVAVPDRAALSFETSTPSAVIDTADTTPFAVASPVRFDHCLALLHIATDNSPAMAMDRDRYRAGSAAAVSLVFGIRFALGPSEVQKAQARRQARQAEEDRVSVGLWPARDGVGNSQALAISEYRRCRSQQALDDLNDNWRWKR